MRTFTHFKPGDTVEVQEHCRKFWLSINQNPTTIFAVQEVKLDVTLHAYEEECSNPEECHHPFIHPDQLVLEGGRIVSGFWFDPECSKYQPKGEQNG